MIVENGIMKHTKGDTGNFRITRLKLSDGTSYTLVPGDTLIFSVRVKPTRESELLLQKSSSTNEFSINPEDTEHMKPGKYSADIELRTAYGAVYTVWPPKARESKGRVQPNVSNMENFWLWPEVT